MSAIFALQASVPFPQKIALFALNSALAFCCIIAMMTVTEESIEKLARALVHSHAVPHLNVGIRAVMRTHTLRPIPVDEESLFRTGLFHLGHLSLHKFKGFGPQVHVIHVDAPAAR